jgi:putative transcription factor
VFAVIVLDLEKRLSKKRKPIVHEKTYYKPKEPEYIDEIIPNSSELIRNAVTSKNIQEDALAKRIGMKESVLKAYMKGSLKPSLEDARTLEKFFSIKLIERIKDNTKPSVNMQSKSADLTIGDMIRIKKRN